MGAIRWLELDSNTNINISADTLVGSYTCDADRLVFATLYAQELAGGGDYVYYVTVTPSGLSEGEALKTTQTLGAATFRLFGQTVGIALRNGDVLKVYLKGRPGDIATPDTRVNFYEDASLQPTTPGVTYDNPSLASGTAQASTVNYITLAAGESAISDTYNNCVAVIIAGTGVGQARIISNYVGATKRCFVTPPWITAPDITSIYRIYPFSGILLADSGAVVAASPNTVTLSTTAPAVANAYIGHTIFIASGTGIGQARIITDYTVGRVATVSPPWDVEPDVNSVYLILPVGRVFVNEIGATALSAISADVDTVLTASHGAGAWTSCAAIVLPTGAIEFTYTVTNSVTLLPIEGVEVIVSTDNAWPPANIIWRGTTDTFGVARDILNKKPFVDPGTYYFWSRKGGYTFGSFPDTEIAS